MAKTNLKSSAARRPLKPYREPHWVRFPTALIRGASLGFRRSPDTGAETWHARVYVDGKYYTSNLGRVRPEFEFKDAYRSALDWAKTVKYIGHEAKERFTLQDVIDEYLKKLQGNSSKRNLDRRDQAEMRLDALIPDRFREGRIENLTARDVSHIQSSYQQRTNNKNDHISPESVNRVMTHFIAALNHGYRLGMIETNSAWKHYQRLPEEPHKRKNQDYVSRKVRDSFISHCPKDLKTIVAAMDYFGARPSELIRLKVSDVDLKRGNVRLTTFKGKARTRDYPLPSGAKVRPQLEKLVKGKEPSEPVFKTQSGKPWTQANLAKAHKAVRLKVELKDSFNTYSWRHCRITDLVHSGAGLGPNFSDTSEKTDNGRGGVSCQNEENSVPSSNARRSSWPRRLAPPCAVSPRILA